MTPVWIDDAAEAEFLAAVEWYAERGADLATRFVDDVERVLALVGESPLRWPIRRGRARQCLLREFPYAIVYRYAEGDPFARVIAIVHQNRRPGYWRKR